MIFDLDMIKNVYSTIKQKVDSAKKDKILALDKINFRFKVI